ncbi:MAG: hypothetical protein HKL96_03040 [Phycisphaerales bacterium]|nr:hypothetical protein [Phycisphaerales bacterium]
MLNASVSTTMLAMSSQAWAEISGGALAFVVLVWFALRYWIASTRDPQINEIPTPTIDRMNHSALEKMRVQVEAAEQGDEMPEEILAESVDEAAPDDLLQVVPEDEHTHAPHLQMPTTGAAPQQPAPKDKAV